MIRRLFAVAGRAFRTPRFPWVVAAIAFLLVAPTIRSGFLLDDHLHNYVLDGNAFPGGPRGVWDLYRFADGGAGTGKAIAQGIYPWWSNPELRLAFLRPLSSLLRVAEHTVFPGAAWPSHLVACLMYAGLALGAARLYRRVLGGAAAGLAALLYAIDDAHALDVLWIANRHALVSTVIALAALSLHVDRERPERPSWRSAIVLLLALLAGESALGVVGYLFAYEVFSRNARPGEIARSLGPHGAVLVVWAAVYKIGGYGGGGNAFYVDPIRQPLEFAVAVVERCPRLIMGQLFLPPSELWAALGTARLVPFLVSMTVASISGALVYRSARAHPAAKWLGAGSLLSLVPLAATLPDDRLLLLPGFGAMGLVALALGRGATRWTEGTLGLAARGGVGLFAAIHLLLAPLLLPLRMENAVRLFGGFTQRMVSTLPPPEHVAGRDVIVLSTVDPFFPAIASLQRYYHLPEAARPRSFRILTVQQVGQSTMERDGSDAVVVRTSEGMFTDVMSTVYYRGRFRAGEERVVGDMRTRVLDVDGAGQPTAVRFQFVGPLEEKRWLVYEGRGMREVEPPREGASMVVPATPFLTAVMPE
jgi:hypothetical protein